MHCTYVINTGKAGDISTESGEVTLTHALNEFKKYIKSELDFGTVSPDLCMDVTTAYETRRYTRSPRGAIIYKTVAFN